MGGGFRVQGLRERGPVSTTKWPRRRTNTPVLIGTHGFSSATSSLPENAMLAEAPADLTFR